MTITQAIERLGRVDPKTALVHAVEATVQKYEDLNRDQLVVGKTKTGIQLSPPYSAAYVKVRNKKGLQTDHVDLKNTGQFYAGFTAEVSGNRINLSSSVDYEKYLSSRYTENIYGLTNENMIKYRAIVAPIILAEVKVQFRG